MRNVQVPALCAWLLPTDLLHTSMLPALTRDAIARLRASPESDNNHHLEGADLRVPSDRDRSQVRWQLVPS